MSHVATVPRHDNDWSPWYCKDCAQYCSGGSLCDHCQEEESAWFWDLWPAREAAS